MNKTISIQKRYGVFMKLSKALAIPAGLVFAALCAALIWFYNNLSSSDLGPEWLAITVALSILFLAGFHIPVLYTLWLRSRTAESPRLSRSISIALGCLSIVSLAISAVALSDIGHQTEAGLSSTSEWTIILINNIILLLFLAFSLIEITAAAKKRESSFIINDGALFITINEVGTICSVLAVCAIVFGLLCPVLERFREHIILIYTVIALAPWGLMLIGWFLSRRKKVSSWWDEKQVRDMGRASFFALISVIAIAVILYAAGLLFGSFNPSIVWFPTVTVAAVLVFSSLSAAYSRWGI